MSLLSKTLNVLCKAYGLTAGRLNRHRVILCYHNVTDERRTGRGRLGKNRSIPMENFEQQMRWLHAHCEVVSLDDLMSPANASGKIRVAITFDDGYLNNIEVVMPILQRLDIPMTWFVSTGFIDNPGEIPWWDMIDLLMESGQGRLELATPEVAGSYDLGNAVDRQWINRDLRVKIKALPEERRREVIGELQSHLAAISEVFENAFARADEIAAIDGGRVELGGHTVTHPNLATCTDTVLDREIVTGKSRLEEISGQSLKWFAYPFGGPGSFDTRAATAVRDAGFKAAVTLVPGVVKADADPYLLPRVPISASHSMADFKARVEGTPVFAYAHRLRRQSVTAAESAQ